MKSIVVVEDDLAVLDVITMMLQKVGYQVNVFSNGLDILENRFAIPDLFIIDKQLSGVDGLDICGYLKVRSDTAYIPIIVISASPNVAILARHMGADDFIEKPFERQQLLNCVSKHLKD
jgi:DNA-binding response OmpR family regulator